MTHKFLKKKKKKRLLKMVGPMESWKCHLSGGLHLQPKTTWWQQTAELGWVQLWPWTSYNKAGTVGQTAEIERPGISLWRQMWTLKLLLPGPTGHIISSYLSWSRFWPTPPTHTLPTTKGWVWVQHKARHSSLGSRDTHSLWQGGVASETD